MKLFRVFWLSVRDYSNNDNFLAVASTGNGEGVIDLYGGPGVEHRLELSERIAVRSLHFASSLFRLVCVGKSPIFLMIRNRDFYLE